MENSLKHSGSASVSQWRRGPRKQVECAVPREGKVCEKVSIGRSTKVGVRLNENRAVENPEAAADPR